MKDKEFNNKINELEKLYNTNGHQMVLNNMHKSIIKLNKLKNGNVKKKREIVEPTKDEKYDLVVLIILIIVGILIYFGTILNLIHIFWGLFGFFLVTLAYLKQKRNILLCYIFSL